MENSAKKTRKKINVIDVIIILLVLALIGTVTYRVYGLLSNGSSNKGSDYIVSFECDAEYITMLSYLKSGKAVYLDSNKSLLGYIYDDPNDDNSAVYEIIETSADKDEEATEEGTTKASEAYRRVKFAGKLKLSSEAIKAKSGNYYTVMGRNISVGSTLEVYTDEAVFTMTVKNISKAGK